MNRTSDLLRLGAAVASGLLLASAFPPMGASEAAWAAFVPLLYVARFSSPFTAFKWGFAGGALFWLISLAWLLRLSQTGGPLPLVALGWLLLSCYCALYTGAFLLVVSALWQTAGNQSPSAEHRTPMRDLGLLFVIPLLWVGFEYLRSNLFTGFPWNALGVSQFRNLAIIQVAEWGGVYSVSALIMMMNTTLALTAFRLVDVYRRRSSSRIRFELMIGLLAWALCWFYGVRTVRDLDHERVRGIEVRIAAIQPNIPQVKKWTDEFVSDIYDALKTQTDYVLTAKDRLDLIVWPETAVPDPVETDPESAAFVRGLAIKGVPILVGSMEVENGFASDYRLETVDNRKYYNSSFLFGSDGEIIQRYRKRHLVPFGEYLPFDKSVGFIRKLAPLGFSCWPGGVSTVFRLRLEHGSEGAREYRDRDEHEVAFSVLICFEDSIASLAAESVRNGAGFLVNQTNDAWFDGSSAALQHLSHYVFRCVENRVGGVRSANTGVTCFIDKTGRIENGDLLESREWDMCVPGFKLSSVFARDPDMPLTFYTRYGDIPFALPCGVMAAALFVLAVIREKKKGRI